LTLSYRLHDLLGQTPFTDQKRYADFFEAYIGAAWVSASETKDPVHIQEIELFLSQLFKPRIWPALESLTEGSSTDLSTAVQFDQSLNDETKDDDDIAVFAIPPARLAPTKKMVKKALKAKKDNRTQKARMEKLADITERNRQHALLNRIRDGSRSMLVRGDERPQFSTPIRASSSGSSRIMHLRDRSSERKRQSAITNRVAKKLSARSLHPPHATPVKSRLSDQTTPGRAGPGPSTKVFRLQPGDATEKELDLGQDEDWEDIISIPGPMRLTRTDRYVGSLSGTSGVPIVV
jgi:hypothetical protein